MRRAVIVHAVFWPLGGYGAALQPEPSRLQASRGKLLVQAPLGLHLAVFTRFHLQPSRRKKARAHLRKLALIGSFAFLWTLSLLNASCVRQMPILRLKAASLPHSAPSPACLFVPSRHQRTTSRVRVSLNHAQRTSVLNRSRKKNTRTRKRERIGSTPTPPVCESRAESHTRRSSHEHRVATNIRVKSIRGLQTKQQRPEKRVAKNEHRKRPRAKKKKRAVAWRSSSIAQYDLNKASSAPFPLQAQPRTAPELFQIDFFHPKCVAHCSHPPHTMFCHNTLRPISLHCTPALYPHL